MSSFNFKDEKEVEMLFRKSYSELVSFANRYLANTAQSEEIIQEVFYKLWSKGEILQLQTSIEYYLFGAVRNACMNQIKHEKVKTKYEEYQKSRHVVSHALDHLEISELEEKINDAIILIPAKCREVFLLSREKGKKYHEIADILNLSIKTVENQMGKALKILRTELRDYIPTIILLLVI